MKDLNYDILKKALGNLPKYTPEQQNWKLILSALEQEEKDFILRKAIDELPLYSPGEESWNGIEKELTLKQNKTALPSYSPPDFIWDQIESSLPKETSNVKKNEPKIARKRYLTPMYRWVSAAAVILVFVISYFSLQTETQENVVYSEEWVTETEEEFWMDQDAEEALELLTVMCEDQPIVCDDPAFKDLEKELEFLNKSLEEFQLNMSAFDDDETLIAELTELEIERNEVVKSMIDKIL